MATSPEYTAFIMDLLQPLRPGASSRKMFGGVGIYLDGIMFGLITSEDVFHFRVDDVNRSDYEAVEMPQFMRMPYFEVPADVMEDEAVLDEWMTRAIEASRRAAAKKRRRDKIASGVPISYH